MKKIYFLPLISSLALCLAAPAALAADTLREAEKWAFEIKDTKTLADLKATDGPGKESSIITHVSSLVANPPPEIPEVKAAAFVLTQKTFGLADPTQMYTPYLLIYADVYYLLAQMVEDNLPLQKTYLRNALSAVMAFEAVSMADNLRCKTPADWKTYKTEVIFPRLTKFNQAYLAFNGLEYKAAMTSMLNLEESMVGRPANPALCAGTAPNPVDLFVDPYSWTNLRKDSHGIMTRLWVKRYEDVTKTSLP